MMSRSFQRSNHTTRINQMHLQCWSRVIRIVVVVLETGPVARSKITKKRDERTEGENREIIERTEERPLDILRALSCQFIHYSSRAAYKCATHAGSH